MAISFKWPICSWIAVFTHALYIINYMKNCSLNTGVPNSHVYSNNTKIVIHILYYAATKYIKGTLAV